MTPDMTSHALWTHDSPLLLASASLARRTLLSNAGLSVEHVAADIDERAIESELVKSGSGPEAVACALSDAKALAVSAGHVGRLVLGCDQTLVCDGEAFHKPRDRAGARDQVARLAGCEHVLTSGFSLVRDGLVLSRGSDTARLRMRPLSDALIERYLDAAGAAAFMSVGAYQLEKLGVHLFDKVDGNHFTVLGLPLFGVLQALREIGAVAA